MRGDGGGGGLATSIATQPAILTELIDDVTERRSVFFPEIREQPHLSSVFKILATYSTFRYQECMQRQVVLKFEF